MRTILAQKFIAQRPRTFIITRATTLSVTKQFPSVRCIQFILLTIFFCWINSNMVYAEVMPAVLHGEEEVIIKSKTQGAIIKVLKVEGEQVHANDVLAIIDDEQERIELEAAKLEMETAKIEWEKAEKLEKYVSQEEIYNKKTNYLKKKTTYDLKEYGLKNTRIVSPMAGIISKQFVKNWTTVNSGENVYEVISSAELIIELDIPAPKAINLKNNQKLKFICELDKSKEYFAEVFYVGQIVEKASGTIKVKLKVKNKKHEDGRWELKAGSLVDVIFETRT